MPSAMRLLVSYQMNLGRLNGSLPKACNACDPPAPSDMCIYPQWLLQRGLLPSEPTRVGEAGQENFQ